MRAQAERNVVTAAVWEVSDSSDRSPATRPRQCRRFFAHCSVLAASSGCGLMACYPPSPASVQSDALRDAIGLLSEATAIRASRSGTRRRAAGADAARTGTLTAHSSPEQSQRAAIAESSSSQAADRTEREDKPDPIT
jgi:hypothetical protein